MRNIKKKGSNSPSPLRHKNMVCGQPRAKVDMLINNQRLKVIEPIEKIFNQRQEISPRKLVQSNKPPVSK